ncbi:MAG TPA: sulfatase [Gemmatales bacterium]|nr:sulfatase [Gemmatales bacterium]
MNRLYHLLIFWLALLMAHTTFAFGEERKIPNRPNIILIYVDDMGYGDLGCYGNTVHRTPHLDQLAREGARFTDFYVAQAVCSASRASLLTGCYPNRIGILGALGPKAEHGISDQETTIAQLLKTKGYHTAIYGKWHLGHHPQFLPTRHGFDEYYGLPYSNDMWPKHPTAAKNYPDLPLIEGEKAIAFNSDQTRLTTDLTGKTVDFIRRHRAEPFFIYLAHPMPHVPLHVSKERAGKSKGGLYGDVIEEIDWSVEQILDTLQQTGLSDKTLVIFSSDNGPWLSYGNHGGSSGGLREGKGTTFEGGQREPFIARWPGVIPAGLVSHEPCMTIDLLPTLAQITGARLPDHKIDGLSILPLLTERNAPSPHQALYYYWNKELQAVRSGPWKLHLPHSYSSLKTTPGKDGAPGVYEQRIIPLSLFHLMNDPEETTNLVEKEPSVVSRILKHVEQARHDLGDSLTRQSGNGLREPGKLR